jgi:hypothetical protein
MSDLRWGRWRGRGGEGWREAAKTRGKPDRLDLIAESPIWLPVGGFLIQKGWRVRATAVKKFLSESLIHLLELKCSLSHKTHET